MNKLKFDALPQLAIGSHSSQSGRACIMNAISWLEGDRDITDMPSCVWPPLAMIAQSLNDNICTVGHHGRQVSIEKVELHNGDEGACTVTLLCPACTHKMWMFGTRLIGSSGTNLQLAQIEEIGQRFLTRAVDLIEDQGGCELVTSGMRAMLAGEGTAGDLQALWHRHLAEHTDGHIDDNASYVASCMIQMSEEPPGSPIWLEELASAVRIGGDFEDPYPYFTDLVDIFEEVAFFLATPPTPQEVREMAEKAKLVYV